MSFIGMAIWMNIPDGIKQEETQAARKLGVFDATLVTLFLAGIGDKTRIATIAMAARRGRPLIVVLGTTPGMLITDVPAVFIGDKLSSKIPMTLVHSIAAAVFGLLGIATLLGADACLATLVWLLDIVNANGYHLHLLFWHISQTTTLDNRGKVTGNAKVLSFFGSVIGLPTIFSRRTC